MSQYRRLGKNLETPRPLNAGGGGGMAAATAKSQYEINGTEELILLIENVATTLINGAINAEHLSMLTYNLRIHGPRLEEIAKDTLDRTFVVLRNSSQDERLSIMTRLNLLELIELRAKHWQVSNDINSYYHQSKGSSNKVEVSSIFFVRGPREITFPCKFDSLTEFNGSHLAPPRHCRLLDQLLAACHQSWDLTS